MSGEEGIQVFVRVRPQNKKESQLNRSAIEVRPYSDSQQRYQTSLTLISASSALAVA